MDAIVNLSQAILGLAKALESTNVKVDISHCTMTGDGSGPGISVNLTEPAAP